MELFWNMLLFFGGAVVGAFSGVFAERIWQRIESLVLLRINIGSFENVDGGAGVTMKIENVGWDELPEYEILLFHLDRGAMSGFQSDGELVFPQLPRQVNKFHWYTKSKLKAESFDFLKNWFHGLQSPKIENPIFDGFELRIILKNSEHILFAHSGMGNYLAQKLFVRLTGDKNYERVNDFYYVSKAPWWAEWMQTRRTKRMLRDLKNSRSKTPTP